MSHVETSETPYAEDANGFVSVLLGAYRDHPEFADFPLSELSREFDELYPDPNSVERQSIEGLSYFQASWCYNKAQRLFRETTK